MKITKRSIAVAVAATIGALTLTGCFDPGAAPPAAAKSTAVVDCEQRAAEFARAHASIAARSYSCVDDNAGLRHLKTGGWREWDGDVWIVAYAWPVDYTQTLAHETCHDWWLRHRNHPLQQFAWASIRGVYDVEDQADVCAVAIGAPWRSSYCDWNTGARCYAPPTQAQLDQLRAAGLVP